MVRYPPDSLYVCEGHIPDDAAWHLHHALVRNASSATPTVEETLVQEAPIHVGGLGRPYEEILQLRYTADGRAALSYVADVDEGEARPMFAIERASP